MWLWLWLWLVGRFVGLFVCMFFFCRFCRLLLFVVFVLFVVVLLLVVRLLFIVFLCVCVFVCLFLEQVLPLGAFGIARKVSRWFTWRDQHP